MTTFYEDFDAAQAAASELEYAVVWPVGGKFQVVSVTICPPAVPPKPMPVADRHMVRAEIKRPPRPETCIVKARLVDQSEKYVKIGFPDGDQHWVGRGVIHDMILKGDDVSLTLDKPYAEKRGFKTR